MEKHITVGKSKLSPSSIDIPGSMGQQKQRLYQQAVGVSEKKDKQKEVSFLDIASSESVFSRSWSG